MTMKRRRLTDYARLQRWIRSQQPKVTAEAAHAQALRALAAAHQQSR